MKIGLQLYTVRNFTETREALESTLQKVKNAGYDCVEPAGYCGLSVADFKGLLDKYGLEAVSTHTGMEAMMHGFQNNVATHKTLGAKHMSIPGMPGSAYCMTPAGYTAFGERMNAYAEELAKEGMTLSYHNHGHEFILRGTECGQRYMFDNAPLLNLQLDVGHCYAAGENPTAWLKRYADRIKTVHYKDVRFESGKRRDTPIGEGEVDWASVTNVLLGTGCEYIIVEHEEFIRDPWDCLETSHKNITKFLGR